MAGSSMTVELEIWSSESMSLRSVDLIWYVWYLLIPAFWSSSSTLPSSKHQNREFYCMQLWTGKRMHRFQKLSREWTNFGPKWSFLDSWTATVRQKSVPQWFSTVVLLFQSHSCVVFIVGKWRGFAHWAEPMYKCFSFPSKKRAALNCLDSKARAAKETHHLADCQSASPVSMRVFFEK